MERFPLEIFIQIAKRLHKCDRDYLALTCKALHAKIQQVRSTFICYQEVANRYPFLQEAFPNSIIQAEKFLNVCNYIPRDVQAQIDGKIYFLVIIDKKVRSYRLGDEFYLRWNDIFQKCNIHKTSLRSFTLLGYEQVKDQISYFQDQVRIRLYYENNISWREIIDVLTIFHLNLDNKDLIMLSSYTNSSFPLYLNFYFYRLRSFVLYVEKINNFEICKRLNVFLIGMRIISDYVQFFEYLLSYPYYWDREALIIYNPHKYQLTGTYVEKSKAIYDSMASLGLSVEINGESYANHLNLPTAYFEKWSK